MERPLTIRSVYFNYMKASKGWITIPVILLNAVLMQGLLPSRFNFALSKGSFSACQTLNNYTLVWWQAKLVPLGPANPSSVRLNFTTVLLIGQTDSICSFTPCWASGTLSSPLDSEQPWDGSRSWHREVCITTHCSKFSMHLWPSLILRYVSCTTSSGLSN